MSKASTMKAAFQGTTNMRAPDVAPVLGAKATHGVIRESNVDILFMLSPEQERLVRVKVWSKMKPGLFRFTDIKVAGNSRARMESKCGTAAGAITEQLHNLYGDTMEPGQNVKDAERHFRELCAHMDKGPQATHANLADAQKGLRELFTPENLAKYGEKETSVH